MSRPAGRLNSTLELQFERSSRFADIARRRGDRQHLDHRLINARSVARGGETAFGLTSVKVGFLLCLALARCCFATAPARISLRATTAACARAWRASARMGLAGLGAGALGALWAYDGWSNVAPLMGELRDPVRNTPRVFIGGMLVVGASMCS